MRTEKEMQTEVCKINPEHCTRTLFLGAVGTIQVPAPSGRDCGGLTAGPGFVARSGGKK